MLLKNRLELNTWYLSEKALLELNHYEKHTFSSFAEQTFYCNGYIKVLNMSHEVYDLLELWLEMKLELDVYQADYQAQHSTGRQP